MNTIRSNWAKVVGQQHYRFAKLPWAPVPTLCVRTACGDVILPPFNNGTGGWVCGFNHESRSAIATGPLVLSCSTDTLLAVPVAFVDADTAALAGTYCARQPDDGLNLYWASGAPIWRQVPQATAKLKA
jgi:hypothetical protein